MAVRRMLHLTSESLFQDVIRCRKPWIESLATCHTCIKFGGGYYNCMSCSFCPNCTYKNCFNQKDDAVNDSFNGQVWEWRPLYSCDATYTSGHEHI